MKNRKQILRECMIPLAVILVLLSVFFYRNARREEMQRSAVTGEAENSAITVRQKGTKKQGGLLETKQTIDVEIIRDGLRNMSFLVTEEYYFTEVLTNKKVVSFLFPVGEESYMVSYDGYIPAGIDFSKIGAAVDEETRTITISLPEAEMKDPVIDYESVQILSEKHTIFTDFSEEERNKAILEFQEHARKKALEKGILKRADENAELVVRNFVMSVAGPEYRVAQVRRP